MYKTQKEQVLEYLQKHKKITTKECGLVLDIWDLQKAIQLLREDNYKITDKWIVNKVTKKRHKEYRLEG